MTPLPHIQQIRPIHPSSKIFSNPVHISVDPKSTITQTKWKHLGPSNPGDENRQNPEVPNEFRRCTSRHPRPIVLEFLPRTADPSSSKFTISRSRFKKSTPPINISAIDLSNIAIIKAIGGYISQSKFQRKIHSLLRILCASVCCYSHAYRMTPSYDIMKSDVIMTSTLLMYALKIRPNSHFDRDPWPT